MYRPVLKELSIMSDLSPHRRVLIMGAAARFSQFPLLLS
jgi:hypothetical protein